MLQDFRLALRKLARTPGFTVVALLTLTLGIGASAASFTVVNGVLLSALPFEDPDRLVVVSGTQERLGLEEQIPISYLDFADLREGSRDVLVDLVGFSLSRPFNLQGSGRPEVFSGEMVSHGYFALLGAQPLLGRTFAAEEDLPPAGLPVVVVSYELWQQRLGGVQDLTGQTLLINGEAYDVIGVMPRDFAGLSDEARLWLPLTNAATLLTDNYISQRRLRWLNLLGRLAPGVSIQQAQQRLATLAAGLAEVYPDSHEDIGTETQTLADAWFGDLRFRLLTVLGGAAFLLLIACVNIANLLLARGLSRKREISVRAALGAGRWRLIRELLAESLLLSIAGCVLGLLLAHAAVGTLVAASGIQFDSFVTIAIGPLVVVVILAVSILCGLSFGLVSGLTTSQIDLNETLKEGSRGSGGVGRHRLQHSLVVAEVALALALVVVAGLTLRSFQNQRSAPLNFDPENLISFRADLKGKQYGTAQAQFTLTRNLYNRLTTMPGIASAALSSPNIPTDLASPVSITVEEWSSGDGEDTVQMLRHHVSPGYFRTLGTELLDGRDFQTTDLPNNQYVVIISAEAAERYFDWPEKSPLGKRLKPGERSGEAPWLTVVGIAPDIRHRGFSSRTLPHPDVYFPIYQHPSLQPPLLNFLVRPSTLSPAAAATAAREEVWSVAPDLPLYDVAFMEQRLEDQVAPERFQLLLISIFASLALALAAVGIYGVISYSVNQRTQEIGIRMALGAHRGDVVKLIVTRGARLALLGVGLGLVGAFALSRVLRSLLFGVQPADPLTLAGTALLLLAVALVASYLPARRATKVPPTVTLRAD